MSRYYVLIGEHEIGLDIVQKEGATIIAPLSTGTEGDAAQVDFAPVHSVLETGEGLYSLLADGKSYQVHVERTSDGLRMMLGRFRLDTQVLTEREWHLRQAAPRQGHASGQAIVNAPMPGLVKSVAVAEGDHIHKGQKLVVLEAMKMENEINAPRDGVVVTVHVSQGTTIEAGKPLVTLE